MPVADDATHATLSRAHGVSQTELGHFGTESAGWARMVDPSVETAHIQETEARQALTDCRLPEPLWSLNPYTGCAHDCVYCYVPDVTHVERSRYGRYVIVKRNLPRLLGRELKRKEPRAIFLSSATDPYQPAEGIYHVTRRCLQVLARHGSSVRVLTRSPLVVRDLDVLREVAELAIGMTIPTIDDAARRVIEPTAPPIEGRLRAIRKLANAGLEPFVHVMPAYPFAGNSSPRALARALRDAGVSIVHAGPWRYLDGVLPALRERVAGTPYQDWVRTVQDPDFADRQMRALRAACEAEGLVFRGGRRYARPGDNSP